MPCSNILRRFLPHPTIADYVSNIVVVENGNPHRDVVLPLIANGYPGIAFQTTDSGLTSNGKDKIGTLFLYGQFVRPVELYTRGRLTFIAYFFHPHVLKSLTGIDGAELTDQCVDHQCFQPADHKDLEDRLQEATSLKMRISLLNNFVLQLAARHRLSLNKSILYSTEAIRNSQGLISLKNIQNELHITERSLQRLFGLHVGISPKMFARICQFHSTFQQINGGGGIKGGQYSALSDIAYTMGYSDQSHLSRTFKEFTNYSPNGYLKKASEFQDKLR